MHKWLVMMITSFADRIIQISGNLNHKLSLPEGIVIMNPFRDTP